MKQNTSPMQNHIMDCGIGQNTSPMLIGKSILQNTSLMLTWSYGLQNINPKQECINQNNYAIHLFILFLFH